MSSDGRDYLEDMRGSARSAVSYVEGMDLAAFRQDQKTQDAVADRVGIIGEAARLIVWTTVTEDLPALIALSSEE